MGIGDIVGVYIYRSDALVVRLGEAPMLPEHTRGVITRWTRTSRRRLAFVANNTDVHFRTMITLTYPREYPCDGRVVKRHLNAFLTQVRREWKGAYYLWFLEFQKRGAPHFHILLDYPLERNKDAKRSTYRRISRVWYNIVDSGDVRHLHAGTRVERLRSEDGGRRYAVKYAQKLRQKIIPDKIRDVGRLWGCSRAVTPVAREFYLCTEEELRERLKEWKHAPGPERPVYRVLYNQGDGLRDHFASGLDGSSEEEYNCPQDNNPSAE
jgi:ribosomal protein L19E